MRLPAVLIALLIAPSIVTGQPVAVSIGEPLTLDAAVAEALEKNLDLIAARAGITVAEANLITARLRPNPVLSVGGDHLDFLGTGFNDENGAGPPEYSVGVDLLMERGGKRAQRIEVAREANAVAEAEVLDRVRALKLEVQGAFIDRCRDARHDPRRDCDGHRIGHPASAGHRHRRRTRLDAPADAARSSEPLLRDRRPTSSNVSARRLTGADR